MAYVGPPDLHDGRVLALTQSGGKVAVFVQGDAGRRFALEFLGATVIRAVAPEGMQLYALAEMTAPPPLRRFVFVNWEDEDERGLELLAREFRVLDRVPNP